MNHVNYSRWMPVHIHDMKSIPKPIKEKFDIQGHWVFSKTNNTFSSILIDQAHEQDNAVKGHREPCCFRYWMLSGPELVILQQHFEDEYLLDNDPDNPKNIQIHEQGLAAQKTFQQQNHSLYKTFKKMENPFLDDLTHDSRTYVNDSELRTLEETGINRYREYVKNVLRDRTDSIHSPIKKVPSLFSRGHNQRSHQSYAGR